MFLMAIMLAATTAYADRAPNDAERDAIETVLRDAGYTSWDEIELDDGDDQVWEVDDAVGADGHQYDLKLDADYKIIDRERE
jgi:hypothetical protein